MTPAVVDRRPVTDALLAMLAVATGRAAYDHGAPSDAEPPYNVVWSIPGGSYAGSLARPFQRSTLVYQIDSVGTARESAQWLADKTAHAMLDRSANGEPTAAMAIGDMAVSERRPQAVPAGVDVGGKPPHEVFSVPARYELLVVPAAA